MSSRSSNRNSNIKHRNHKRWHLSAKIGKNVPIIGGSGIHLGSRGIKSVVKREINKNQQTKVFITAESTGSPLQNTFYTLSPFQGLVAGTADNNRIGQRVFIRHLKIRGLINNLTTIPEFKLRVWVVKTDAQWNNGWAFTSSQIGGSDLVYTATNPVFALNNNKSTCTVICDKTFSVKADFTNEQKAQMIEMDCPIMKEEIYAPSSVFFKEQNYYVVVNGFGFSGVTGVTTVGGVTWTAIVTYKNA